MVQLLVTNRGLWDRELPPGALCGLLAGHIDLTFTVLSNGDDNDALEWQRDSQRQPRGCQAGQGVLILKALRAAHVNAASKCAHSHHHAPPSHRPVAFASCRWNLTPDNLNVPTRQFLFLGPPGVALVTLQV